VTLACLSSSPRPLSTSPPWKCAQSVALRECGQSTERASDLFSPLLAFYLLIRRRLARRLNAGCVLLKLNDKSLVNEGEGGREWPCPVGLRRHGV
jgi:hypothetical protein